jgi:hypothetical protein
MQTIRLWKNGILKELNSRMFESIDMYQLTVDYWYSEGWDDIYPNTQ